MTAMQQYPDFPDNGSHNPAELRAGFFAPLSSLGLISFTGNDAAGFLHRQLTNDVAHLTDKEARLAAYCTPQGRLLANFLVWKSADVISLQVPRDIQAAVQKRLQIFVLREKVNIADDSDTFAQIGLGGTAASETLSSWFPKLPDHPYAKADSENGFLIRLPDAFDTPRYLWIMTPGTLAQVWPILSASLLPVKDHAWKLADIESGIPRITAATQEKLVAQMINFDLLGGVNFKKGCYPGQEIIARTQYIGKARRRMIKAVVAEKTGDICAGTDVYASNDPSQACGIIVNAERRDDKEISCLGLPEAAASRRC